jgi:hypothetical protein
MAEIRDDNASIRWFVGIATLAISAALVAIAYAGDRAYRRWLRENHPLARPRARVARLMSDYRERRASVTEVVQFINEVLDEVARARSMRGAS